MKEVACEVGIDKRDTMERLNISVFIVAIPIKRLTVSWIYTKGEKRNHDQLEIKII